MAQNGEYWVAARAINDIGMLGVLGDEMRNLAWDAGYAMRDVLITVHNHVNAGVFLVVASALMPKDVPWMGTIDVEAEAKRVIDAT